MNNLIVDFVIPADRSEYVTFEDYKKVVVSRLKTTASMELEKDFETIIKLLYELDEENYKAIRSVRVEYSSLKDIFAYVIRALKTHSPAINTVALIKIRNLYDSIVNKFITEVLVKYPESDICELADYIKNSESAVMYCLDEFKYEADMYDISSITREYIDTIATYESIKKNLASWVNEKANIKANERTKRLDNITSVNMYEFRMKQWKKTRNNPLKLR